MSDERLSEPDLGALVGADRVLAVLIELAEHPAGVSLDEISQRLKSPKSTVHRALKSLRRARLATQVGRGVYVLGDEFIRLALQNHSSRPDGALIRPALERLAERYGETAHYAVLDGSEIVYRAKVDPPQGAVRLTSVVGGRNPAYRTAVGKLLLSSQVSSEDDLLQIVGDAPLPQRTERTITTIPALWRELQQTRERGYGLDDQENETGINCLALPVTLGLEPNPLGAVSISAIAFRTPLSSLIREVPQIRDILADRDAAPPDLQPASSAPARPFGQRSLNPDPAARVAFIDHRNDTVVEGHVVHS